MGDSYVSNHIPYLHIVAVDGRSIITSSALRRRPEMRILPGVGCGVAALGLSPYRPPVTGPSGLGSATLCSS